MAANSNVQQLPLRLSVRKHWDIFINCLGRLQSSWR